MSRFGNNLRAARERQQLSAEQAAEACGVSRSTWFAYEAGGTTPPLATLVRIAKALNTTVSKLTKGIEEDRPSTAS